MFHNIHQVSERFGVAPSTIWRWVKDGFFPRPCKLGLATARWREDVLQAFEMKSATQK